ncbi:hypothetical protein BDR07DRAFT_1390583 [Suillus spraguei]|nr:hypothetical protein BDR07DRAFT_1390583 [Suillus spraguei]
MRISIILFITIPSIPYCNPMQHVVPYAEINSCFTPPTVYPSQRTVLRYFLNPRPSGTSTIRNGQPWGPLDVGLLYLFPSHLTGRSPCGSLLHLPTTLSLGAGNEMAKTRVHI